MVRNLAFLVRVNVDRAFVTTSDGLWLCRRHSYDDGTKWHFWQAVQQLGLHSARVRRGADLLKHRTSTSKRDNFNDKEFVICLGPACPLRTEMGRT